MKIRCYGCDRKLDVSELEPLSHLNCPVCAIQLTVPKVFGDLLLEDKIGQGLLAVVYRGMDVTLDREVAVKVLRPEHRNPELQSGFLREARATSSLNHANILPTYSCGETAGEPYLITQYMAGGSLQRRLDKSDGPLPLPQLLGWFVSAALALDAAHQRGICHLDIKPANLLLDLEGNLKLGDFGLANLLPPTGPDPANPAFAEAARAYARYVAPEKAVTGQQGVASDIYSLGATFYHACTGQPPHAGDNAQEILRQHFAGPARRPRELRPELPEALDNLIFAMISLDPAGRPDGYGTIVSALRAMQDAGEGVGESSTIRPPPAAKPKLQPVSAPRPSAPKPVVDPALVPRSPRLAVTMRPPASYRLALLFWRLVPLLLAGLLIALIFGHLLRADWYERNVRPRLPAVGQSSSD